MKKTLLILFSTFSLIAVAQQKKVAVYVTGKQTGINKVLGDQLVAAFAKSGKYIAIERTASFLAELSKAQNYQRTGVVDNNELSRLGKQFGEQLVCVVDVSDVFGEKYVSARMIEVESAEVIRATNANSTMNNMNDLLTLTNKITSDLTAPTDQEQAQAEAKKKALQQQKAEEEDRIRRENRIKQTLSRGYIQVGSYYVTFPALAREEWKHAKRRCAKCRIGGWSDWRFPTETELKSIAHKCAMWRTGDDYYWEKRYLYNTAYSDLHILENECVWLDNGQQDGLRWGCGNDNVAYVILIRDSWR